MSRVAFGLAGWAILTLAASIQSSHASEPLRVDITQGVSSPLLLAVPDISAGRTFGTDANISEDAGVALSRVVRDDLTSTGLYRLVTAGTNSTSLPVWQKAGAQALVVGRLAASGNGQLSFNCTLYDVFAGQSEFSRTISLVPSQWRRAAHKCADMVFEHTTGVPGHFDTRVAYVAETGPKVGRVKQLAVMDYDGANQVVLTRGLELVAMPRFAPDVRSIVYMTYIRRQPKIMIYDLVTGSSRTIDLPSGTVFAPRFSPDGKFLAFSLGQGGDTDIYVYELATAQVRRLTSSPGTDTSPSFSPDGSRIVFESSRSGSQQIYIMASDGSGQTRISFGSGRYASPTWSPSGEFIAFTHLGSINFQIGIMRPDGSRERIITDDWQDESPSWAPSGRALVFLRTRRGEAMPELWTVDLTGKVSRRIGISAGGSDPDWSGKRP